MAAENLVFPRLLIPLLFLRETTKSYLCLIVTWGWSCRGDKFLWSCLWSPLSTRPIRTQTEDIEISCCRHDSCQKVGHMLQYSLSQRQAEDENLLPLCPAFAPTVHTPGSLYYHFYQRGKKPLLQVDVWMCCIRVPDFFPSQENLGVESLSDHSVVYIGESLQGVTQQIVLSNFLLCWRVVLSTGF